MTETATEAERDTKRQDLELVDESAQHDARAQRFFQRLFALTRVHTHTHTHTHTHIPPHH